VTAGWSGLLQQDESKAAELEGRTDRNSPVRGDMNMLLKTKHIVRFATIAILLALYGPAHADPPKADSGKFQITIQENKVGTTTFTSDRDGGSVYDEQLSLGGNKITAHVVIKAGKGVPTQVDADFQPGGKLHLVMNGDKSLLTAGKINKPLKLEAHAFPFDNFAPHLLTSLVAAYNVQKGGAQKFQIVVINAGAPLPATLTRGATKTRHLNGVSMPVTSYNLTVANIALELQVDKNNRILMWNVPAQKYTAVRDGYDALLTATEPPEDPLLSKPTYAVKREIKVMVKMRDGVQLATDVIRPDAPGRFPVILQRTPYGRAKAMEAERYARRGYVFVAQDVRGKFDSEGKWQPFVNEARDGYDAVEWCAAQSWSDGNVGMIGGSYLGFVQWAAAREGSDHLKCLIPIVSPPDPFFNIPYAYGVLFLYPGLWWAAIAEGKGMQAPKPINKLEAMKTLPLTAVDKKVFGHTIPFYQEWLKHPTNDAYWDQVNFNERMKTMKPLPALHVSGWFDGDGIGTKRNYAAMVAAGQPNQRLIYGPWEHAVNTKTKVGELNFGPDSLRDLDTLYLRWFDHFLKGVDNGVDREPAVEAFLMGENRWRKFSAWPPAEAAMQRWYLHSEGHAVGSAGDGWLSVSTPSAGEKPDHYDYDPANPYIPAGLRKALTAGSETPSLDARADEKGHDKLVYSSPTLQKDVAVAGPISLHLVAATSAKDTDWMAYLADVQPDGKSLMLCSGILRARFRKSFTQPSLLTPNRAEEYDVDLWAIGNVFKKGHKIRVVVASSCFPIYDRNLNTGENIATGTRMVVAHQTVFHDNERESYITLPVLPN
jgi:putative CocE/NonD family hydrolase